MNLLCFMIMAVTPLNLYPAPQDISLINDKRLELSSGTPIVVADDISESELEYIRMILKGAGTEFPFVKASRQSGGGPAIYVGEYGRNKSFELRKVRRLLGEKKPDAQGYQIVISDKLAVIAGADSVGTSYGLQTFASIIKSGRELPCVKVVDKPDLLIRGVFIKELPEQGLLQKLADMRCNMIVFSSDDFYNLNDEKKTKWEDAFNTARRLNIEPVPMIDIFDNALPLIEKTPILAEGFAVKENIILKGTRPAPLSHTRIIDSDNSPIKVSISGLPCIQDKDYELIKEPEKELVSIKRLKGSDIPDNATIEVSYSHAPRDVRSCCPNAQEIEPVMEKLMQAIVQVLDPKYIHLGHGPSRSLNRDLRCIATGKSNADIFSDAVSLADRIAKSTNPNLKLILYGDTLVPDLGASWYGLDKAISLLPSDIILNFNNVMSEQASALINWGIASKRKIIVSPGKEMKDIYESCEMLSKAGPNASGFLLNGDVHLDGRSSYTRFAMQKGWATKTTRFAWAQGLNNYFNVSLWKPLYDEILKAMLLNLNSQTLQGVRPSDEYKKFQTALNEVKASLPSDDPDCRSIDQIYQTLIRYLELDASYSKSHSKSVLRDLIKLVRDQSVLDPDLQEDRTEKIISTIQSKELFVPSTVLFGYQLFSYEKYALPENFEIKEIAIVPEITQTEHRIEAMYQFPSFPGDVCRLEFETVGTADLIIERSDDGMLFRRVQSWTSTKRGGVRGPVILDTPLNSRFMKVIAIAPAEQAVLRNVRVFCMKKPAVASSREITQPPVLDALLTDDTWRGRADVAGFERADMEILAMEQTTVMLRNNRDTLFLGAQMFDSKPSSIGATRTTRDSKLWLDESLEILIDTGNGMPFRFIVNSLCSQYDSRGMDASWDGIWHTATRRNPQGWTAEIAIPFASLQTDSPGNATWRVSFIRNRTNIENEKSVWSKGKGIPVDPATFGEVSF